MPINVIDTIEPKNNGKFPIARAKDIEMPDGSRLDKFKGGVASVNGQTGDVVITVTNGKDGVSPSVTVTAITGGHRISITDASGTKTFDVLDGTDGEDGQSASVTVDSAFSETSENPLQNKVITQTIQSFTDMIADEILPNLVPRVTEADTGKALVCVNGVWKPMAVTIPDDAHINELIDTKLGVIENGTY